MARYRICRMPHVWIYAANLHLVCICWFWSSLVFWYWFSRACSTGHHRDGSTPMVESIRSTPCDGKSMYHSSGWQILKDGKSGTCFCPLLAIFIHSSGWQIGNITFACLPHRTAQPRSFAVASQCSMLVIQIATVQAPCQQNIIERYCPIYQDPWIFLLRDYLV